MNAPVWDAIIIGGGAAGLMCAAVAIQRGKRVALLEHQDRVGKKILISGGGRCNFTNLGAGPDNYISQNPDFCRSALARYKPGDFIALVEKHEIAYHEKKLGQLFCDGSSREIVELLIREAKGAELITSCTVERIDQTAPSDSAERFIIHTARGDFATRSVIVATGGLSFAKLGATDIGYRIARQFGLKVTQVRPGLVPLTSSGQESVNWTELSGVSLPVRAKYGNRSFEENMLFTHRGVSGPAILQISSYWQPGEELEFDLLAGGEWDERPAQTLEQLLSGRLPSRFLKAWLEDLTSRLPADSRKMLGRPWGQWNKETRHFVKERLHGWRKKFGGSEGYVKAEVTVGGVDTSELSSKTMEARRVPGLYFIGEVVDVTGWLGGYNFQWAWASGFAVGQSI